jgi:predicted MFS family arabinose efflux permease
MADYATIPVTIGLLAHYVGVNRMGTSMRILAAGHAAGGALGALLGGVLSNLFAGYAATWWAAVILSQTAAVLVISIRFITPGRASLARA